MQLAVDIGNTRVKYALFEDVELIEAGLDERPAPYLIKELFEKNSGITSIILSSVSEEVDADLVPIPETIHHVILDHETPLPITNLYESPETLGHDRIALAVAGNSQFPGRNVLVIDIGTCMTMDVVDNNGNYLGGSISPGINLRFTSMHQGTRRLPQLKFTGSDLPSFIGKSTVECMESGVIQGILHEITGTIKHLETEFEDLKVLLTGGDHALFEGALKNSIFADPNLVLRGLNQILLYNLP